MVIIDVRIHNKFNISVFNWPTVIDSFSQHIYQFNADVDGDLIETQWIIRVGRNGAIDQITSLGMRAMQSMIGTVGLT